MVENKLSKPARNPFLPGTHGTPKLAATNARVRGVPHRKTDQSPDRRTCHTVRQEDPIHLKLLHRSLIEVAITAESTVGRAGHVLPSCTHAFASMPASSTTAAAQRASHDSLTPHTPPTLLLPLLLALGKSTPLT